MPLDLPHLDPRTRSFMVEELSRDIEGATLCISPRLADAGADRYPGFLRAAMEQHDDDWLAERPRRPGNIKAQEPRRTKTGVTMARVPVTAAETLAEGEFNRFYSRALCCCGIEDGIQGVTVCRAKQVANPGRSPSGGSGLW